MDPALHPIRETPARYQSCCMQQLGVPSRANLQGGPTGLDLIIRQIRMQVVSRLAVKDGTAHQSLQELRELTRSAFGMSSYNALRMEPGVLNDVGLELSRTDRPGSTAGILHVCENTAEAVASSVAACFVF